MQTTLRLPDGVPGTFGKVYEADPLLCPRCSREMRIVSLIDDPFPDYDTEPVTMHANGR